MGRRKLEMKRIEDKSRRRVTFSKRRTGLFNKSRQLSVRCDVDVAVIVFSDRGKLYEFSSSGRTNSVKQILSRYEKSWLEAERTITKEDNKDSVSIKTSKFRTCKELLQKVDRLEELNTVELSVAVTDMTQLEQDLHAALVQTRSRKTQLMIQHISTLQEEERKLSTEKEETEKQIASAERIFTAGDDGGGGLNDLATNHMNSPQHLTLPLLTNWNPSNQIL